MKFIYDEDGDSWKILTEQAFATKDIAKEYYNQNIEPNCKSKEFCKCNCGLNKENGDW